jgi:hypothetical protein
MNRANGGMLVAGIWIAGVGAIFLARDAFGWTWGEAWPLFVILAGVASFVSQLLTSGEGPGLWGFVWPLVTVGIGAVLLLTTTGQLDVSLGELVSAGWPWLLVAWGAWNLVAAFWPAGSRNDESPSA